MVSLSPGETNRTGGVSSVSVPKVLACDVISVILGETAMADRFKLVWPSAEVTVSGSEEKRVVVEIISGTLAEMVVLGTPDVPSLSVWVTIT